MPPTAFGRALVNRLSAAVAPGWTTRFAPAPTGWLHLGHAVNAVFVWGLARAAGGRVVLRVEDHDRGRWRSEYEQGLLGDLDWLGLVPDHPAPVLQRERDALYSAALTRLDARVYTCACTRRTIAEQTGDVFGAESRYPGTCRLLGIDPAVSAARRVIIDAGTEAFDDLALGPQVQDPSAQCGDVLVRDRQGQWTYQFAVVVDDIDNDVDVVIRGEDLLASTGRQIRLARMLGRDPAPVFLHHPLIMRADGSKLSKSDGATGLRDLRAEGWSPERVLGDAAWRAGLQEESRPLRAADLAALFC